MAAPNSGKPNVGDILVVIHDFEARSSDELSLAKGDRVELYERDDEFGDGWYLGKHMVNGNSGLFPEVYTRPAPKSISTAPVFSQPKQPLTPLAEVANEQTTPSPPVEEDNSDSSAPEATPVPAALPLSSFKSMIAATSPPPPPSASSVPANVGSGLGNTTRPSTSTDSHVLHDTLNVIDEHITDFNSPAGNASLRNGNDSGSEYSSHMGHRISYIQGEETDEEEEPTHTRQEIESWDADQVAEYLFTVGVEKHHCEVFRDQEITGEVILGMDQTSVFIKALDLGSVGKRLKTWQKIKQLQDDVTGQTMSTGRNTQTYGSDAGSDAGRVRSRTNTITSSGPRFAPLNETSLSVMTKRLSQTPKPEPYEPVSPVSPLIENSTHTFHEKRPSAASVRDLHHSRRHSSTDFRQPGTTPNPSSAGPPKVSVSSAFARKEASHKKQPSFDRNWTLGGAAVNYSQRPLSSAGPQEAMAGPVAELQDSAVELERGYFSGTDADPRRRNVLKKRDSAQASPKASYTEEQRVRSATALSRHSRLGSVDSVRESPLSPAAQKYYGASKRSPSVATTDSLRYVSGGAKEPTNPTVTRLDSNSSNQSQSSPKSAIKRLSAVNHPDFNVSMMLRSGFGGLRAASDAITGSERAKVSPIESPLKESPMYSPTRTGSSTPSGGPSFELDSPDATGKSPSMAMTAASRTSRKKTKQETSAYTRGLLKVTPREAMKDADYSGWMKKRSANLMTTWKPRLFVLKGRRLAYYYSENDDQERGLIDISFHRVLPADNERLTGLHATLTGVSSTPAMPAGSHITTLAAADAERDPIQESDSIFIFKLVPPRAGLSRAVNFTKPTVHYFAVPNIKQGRLWMAALMKATIDRDDTQAITTTYQQKTISLAKARQMRHRPPALMNVEEGNDDANNENNGPANKDTNGLGIVYSEIDSAVAGLDKFGLQHPESARTRGFGLGTEKDASLLPQSA
ncbi:protein BOI2 [Chaetomidium leptoderma]|uniref:Protein BOI2 n=1 Tax=Chaetomidium leptoderma TaxID=669021 RepID=A0AAN6VL80_9PEZI|nr:protein BOI2 [Chaetomidium leptoderma]